MQDHCAHCTCTVCVHVCTCGGHGGAVVWIAQDMMSNRLKQRINSDDFCAMLVNNIVDVYGFLEVPQKQNMRRITRNGPRVCLARAVHAALWVMRIAVVQDSRHATCARLHKTRTCNCGRCVTHCDL